LEPNLVSMANGGFDLSDSFFFGINAAYDTNGAADSGFYGVALYPQITTSDSFAIGLRGEYFQVTDGSSAVGDAITAFTLTGSYSVDNLIIKPELRLDNLTDGFLDNDGAASGSLSSFALAAIYSF